MKQLLLGNAAIDIWECSNKIKGMKQSIIENTEKNIWECSNKLSEMQQSISWNAAIKYRKLGIYYSGMQR